MDQRHDVSELRRILRIWWPRQLILKRYGKEQMKNELTVTSEEERGAE